MNLESLLPAIAWAAWSWAITPWARNAAPDYPRRWAMIVAAVVVGLLAIASLEGLSLVAGVNQPSLSLAWAAAILAAVDVRLRLAGRREPQAPLQAGRIGSIPAVCLAGLAGLGCLCLAAAALAPPNDGDSLTCHLPRLFYWAQNHSLDVYPTPVLNQQLLSPGGEMLLLQPYVLGGGDDATTFVQAWALLICAAAASVVAAELGAGRPAQVFAAVLAGSLPTLLLQASLTKNDVICSAWIATAAAAALRTSRRPFGSLLLFGAAGGLATLTKGYSPAHLLPFALWAARGAFLSMGSASLRPLFLGVVLAASVNAGNLWRCWQLTGSIAPPGDYASTAANARTTPATVASNMLRGLSPHAPLPFLGGYKSVEQGVRSLHAAVGLDPDDRATTGAQYRYHISVHPENFFAHQGNPLHFHLIAATLAGSLACAGVWTRRRIALAGALFVGLSLHCAMIRWYPTNHRYQSSTFVLAGALAAAMIGSRRRFLPLVASGAVLSHGCWLTLHNFNRPFVGPHAATTASRESQYFVELPKEEASMRELATLLADSQATQVGFVGGLRSEYLLLRAAQQGCGPGVRVENVGREEAVAAPEFGAGFTLRNPAAKAPFPLGAFQPEVVLSYTLTATNEKVWRSDDAEYVRVWVRDGLGLYVRTDLSSFIHRIGAR